MVTRSGGTVQVEIIVVLIILGVLVVHVVGCCIRPVLLVQLDLLLQRGDLV